MTFDHNTFATQLDNNSGVSISKPWYQWTGTTGDLNKVMDYDQSSNGYRTWYQETTVNKEGAGMLVSCKIDLKRTTGDDHIFILTGFSLSSSGVPTLVFAQASVTFHGSESNNVTGAPVTSQTSSDIGQGIYNSLSSILNVDFGSVDDTTAGRHTLPSIAQMNVNAIKNAAKK